MCPEYEGDLAEASDPRGTPDDSIREIIRDELYAYLSGDHISKPLRLEDIKVHGEICEICPESPLFSIRYYDIPKVFLGEVARRNLGENGLIKMVDTFPGEDRLLSEGRESLPGLTVQFRRGRSLFRCFRRRLPALERQGPKGSYGTLLVEFRA